MVQQNGYGNHSDDYPPNPLKGVKCECCGDQAIGVCSTIMPYSAGFCQICLENYAQPTFILDAIIMTCGYDKEHVHESVRQSVKAFVNKGYITFDEYFDQNVEKIKQLDEENRVFEDDRDELDKWVFEEITFDDDCKVEGDDDIESDLGEDDDDERK